MSQYRTRFTIPFWSLPVIEVTEEMLIALRAGKQKDLTARLAMDEQRFMAEDPATQKPYYLICGSGGDGMDKDFSDCSLFVVLGDLKPFADGVLIASEDGIETTYCRSNIRHIAAIEPSKPICIHQMNVQDVHVKALSKQTGIKREIRSVAGMMDAIRM